MEKKRELDCFVCGGKYILRKTELNGILVEAYVCPKCGDTVLTKEQSKKYVELLSMKEAAEAERKIIRVGSSMGITLPEGLKKFGMKIGKKVKLEAVGRKSIKITLI